MWLVRLLETEGDWFKGQSQARASALSHTERQPGHAESDLCHVRSLSVCLSLTHKHADALKWGLWVYFKVHYAAYGVCVRKQIPLP